MQNGKDDAIEVHDLTVSYDNKPVLWDIDFTLPQGEMIGILGPNGSGKTTLLKAIMDLIDKDCGQVTLLDQPLDKVRNKISYVPQRGSVDWDFPANVYDVALMGRYGKRGLFKRFSKEDHQIAMESLEKVGMDGFKNRQISQLSGGQQQRVFLARALAQQADLYIMDEPFAGVDAATENAIVELLKTMKDEGKTLIVVHHDLQSVIAYFNWLVLLNGRLIAAGPASEVFTQKNLQAAYGGQLDILSKVGNQVKKEAMPIREE